MTDNIFKETQQPSKQSNAQVIWDACVSLQNAERKISRRVLFELTGLRMTIIDDHVERAYPRSRGATPSWRMSFFSAMGLSPLARGNR